MRTARCWIGVIALSIGSLTTCTGERLGRAAGASTGMPWAPTLSGALERARAERKLVMVDLVTDWRAAGGEFDRTTLADARVGVALGRVVPLKLDAERDGRDLAELHGEDGYPRLLFLDGSGDEVGRISGLLAAGPFLEEFGGVLSRPLAAS
ncbi:MAG: thioredoxin family protein [Acidobacteriota bacterium]